MTRTARILGSLLTAVLWGSADTTEAVEDLGTFQWQRAPFCNVVTLEVGPVFLVSGWDDACGVGARAPVTGTASPAPWSWGS